MKSNSQASHDIFVTNIMQHKKNGTFVEIGSNDATHNNNSYLLESEYGWRGIMVEYDPYYLESYKTHRTNSFHIINDATKVDYKQAFENNNMPLVIDYLQIDLDVDNRSTLMLFNETIFDKYTFATITFEHDIYTGNFYDTREISRKILIERGYVLLFPDVQIALWTEDNFCAFEDWYIHPNHAHMNIQEIQKHAKPNMNHTEIASLLQMLSIFDQDIKTEYKGNITSTDDQFGHINNYHYSMFKNVYTKNEVDYVSERVCIKNENFYGINGLNLVNNVNDEKRFVGAEHDSQDGRLFEFNDKLYIISNCKSPYQTDRCLAISEYDNFDPIFLQISENTENIKLKSVEKNWSPLVIPDKDTDFIYLIYNMDPLIVLKYNFNRDGMCDVVYSQKNRVTYNIIKGGTPFIHLTEQYYICAAHSRLNTDIRYYYLPFICILDINTWEFVYMSKIILFNSEKTDSFTKINDTDIMVYMQSVDYSKPDGSIGHMDRCINYPINIQKIESTNNIMKFNMITQLDGPTLKYTMFFDINTILQKITNKNINWEEKIIKDNVEFLTNIPCNKGVTHQYFMDL